MTSVAAAVISVPSVSFSKSKICVKIKEAIAFEVYGIIDKLMHLWYQISLSGQWRAVYIACYIISQWTMKYDGTLFSKFSWPLVINTFAFQKPLTELSNTHCLCNILFRRQFLAATKQLYKWYFPSVCPSVCPSVRLSVTPFWLCSHHRIIMKFSGVITNDQRKVHAKGQGQRSKVKVTEVTTQLNRFRTVTPVWIHIWWWNDAYSLMLLRRGALLFFKVILQISRSHGSKNRRIWPRLGVSGL